MENGIKKKENYYLIVTYIPDENNKEKMKILDKKFIKNNKIKCIIVYKNKIYELKEYFGDIDKNYNYKDLIKLKIIFIHNVIDMSYMFFECGCLNSLSDNNGINKNVLNSQIKIINMHFMFFGCKSLVSLPDMSKWDTSNVFYMHKLFYGCNSLNSLPDLSEWNTSNVKSMNEMFNGVKSTLKLPNFYLLYLYLNNITFELTYKIKNNKIKILDKTFINNNKEKIKLIYNNCKLELKEYFEDIKNNQKDIFKFILCLDKSIYDISYIFRDCTSLISVENYKISKV